MMRVQGNCIHTGQLNTRRLCQLDLSRFVGKVLLDSSYIALQAVSKIYVYVRCVP